MLFLVTGSARAEFNVIFDDSRSRTDSYSGEELVPPRPVRIPGQSDHQAEVHVPGVVGQQAGHPSRDSARCRLRGRRGVCLKATERNFLSLTLPAGESHLN
jgi:hypothetical protein